MQEKKNCGAAFSEPECVSGFLPPFLFTTNYGFTRDRSRSRSMGMQHHRKHDSEPGYGECITILDPLVLIQTRAVRPGSDSESRQEFKPLFTYPIFGEREVVFGYKKFSIQV